MRQMCPPIAVFFAAVLLAGCSAREEAQAPLAGRGPQADLALFNGRIFTGDPAEPWVEAIAVREGRILARGRLDEIEPLTRGGARLVDLEGRMAMPGLVDAHVHPVWGAVETLYRCNFAPAVDPAGVRAALQACAAALPEGAWLRGGRWGSDFASLHGITSPRAFLDAIESTRPVLLTDDSGHNAWANSAALAALGIDRETPDPAGGRIARDATGEPDGLLLETAAVDAGAAAPAPSAAELERAVRHALATLRGFGLTGIRDASVSPDIARAWGAVARAEALGMHVDLALETPYGRRGTPLSPEALAALVASREAETAGTLHLGTVKFYLDGVPTAARSAAMLAPYQPDAAHPEPGDGELHVPAMVLAQDLAAIARRGFRAKLHTAGDRAVRVALDAIAAAREAPDVPRGLQAELAHAGLIDPADLPRFAALGAVADLSPVLWFPSPLIDSVRAAVGQRAEHYWPVRALLDAGAQVVAGSDWPSAAVNANPWVGIEALVTRADPLGSDPATSWPAQAVGLEEALRIYTGNGAAALGLGAETGTLATGKRADVIVLERDLFAIPPQEIDRTRVLQTWFGGELVFEQEPLGGAPPP